MTRDADEFAAWAGEFLGEQLETNLLATILAAVRGGADGDPPPLFAYGTEAGRVRCAALRTPPRGLICSELPAGAAEELMERWYALDPGIPWVSAVPATARALAAAWARRSAGTSVLRFAEGMHELTAVANPPRPARGRLRVAAEPDIEILVPWQRAFAIEARVEAHGAEENVRRRVGDGSLLIWEDGEPVSYLGVNVPVGGVVRIGPVYTPPRHRRRGYAGTAVARASQRALDGGARACMLFTDLANSTSNKIYAEVGYRRVGDREEIDLVPAGVGRPPAIVE